MHQRLSLLFMFLFPAIGFAPWTAFGQDESLPQSSRVIDFQRDIVPILESRCLNCHGPEDAKNDFRVDDADSLMSFIEPGDVEASALWTDYLRSEDADLQMPPIEHGGPLATEELALLNVWINEGADWPENVVFSSVTTATEPVMTEHAAVGHASNGQAAVMANTAVQAAKAIQTVPTKPTGLIARVWAFQGYLHPATVHFPIALLLMGGLFVVIGWKYPALGENVAVVCLLLGTLSSIAATAMGWSFATRQGYGSWDRIDVDSEIFWHRWSAVVVTLIAVGGSVAAMFWLRWGSRHLAKFWKASLLLTAVLVGAVGHQGGELTYGKTFYKEAFHLLLGTEPAAEKITTVSTSSPLAQPPAADQ